MRLSTRTTNILASVAIAGTMVGTSIWLTSTRAPHADAQSAEELLRAYVAQDRDQDGLSDWQEALYGTDPENPNSLSKEMRDADAVAAGLAKPKFSSETYVSDEPAADVPGINAAPGTLTDRFARKFLENYLRLEQSGPLSADDKDAFIASALKELQVPTPDAYSVLEIRTAMGGTSGLRTYAAAAERAAAAHALQDGAKSELELIQDGMTNKDEAALRAAIKMGEAHVAMGRALMAVEVPREAQQAHVALANAFVRAGTVIQNMAAINTDPILALISIKEYDAAKESIVTSFASLVPVFEKAGVTIESTEPGFYFYNGALRSKQIQQALEEAGNTTP